MARTATADGAGAPAAGIPTTPQEPLTELMQRAVPAGPTSLVGGDPGAALALALHVQMAEYGRCFAVNKNGLENSNSLAPPLGWHGSFPDEWVMEYRAPGKANKFTLHCSLQRVTGRMFVNATEDTNLANNQVLGLLLSNYVSDASLMSSTSWAGVVARQPSLRSMFWEHVLQPLLDNAQDLPERQPSGLVVQQHAAPVKRGAGWGAWLPSRQVTLTVALAVVVAATAAGAALYLSGSRSQRRLQR